MRKIKFRGLRTDGKGWVYGVPFYISGERKCFIIDNCQSAHLTQEDSVFDGKEVKYRSVGQFTGLTDKNGKEIYEGDLVNYKTIVKTDETGENITYKGEIQFWLGQVGCGWRYKSGRYTLMIKRSHAWSMEVIGNIHEKGGQNEKD